MTKKGSDPTWRLADVVAATGGAAAPVVATAFAGVSTDTRAIARGDLYVAIAGERFDGHDFVVKARDAGAAGAIVARDVAAPGLTLVRVADPRRALGDLARFHRRRLRVTTVGVTGSNGKTTTKDLLAAILDCVVETLKTEGNLNNDIGVPRTLLRLAPSHRAAVIEMGMNAPGEIAYLASIAEPTVGVVTNVGAAHIGRLGSLDAIAAAKGELLGALPEDGAAVVPDDEPRLGPPLSRARVRRRLRFGESAGADVRIAEASARGADGWDVRLLVAGAPIELRLPLPGRHNVLNAAAAAACAHALGVAPDAIARGLAGARPTGHRSRLAAWEGRTIFDDCYNANPASMAAALAALADLRGSGGGAGRLVAVLGDMFELGAEEERLHAEVGERAAAVADLLVCVGPRSAAMARAAAARIGEDRVRHVGAPADAVEILRKETAPGDVLLFKASRGTRLEIALDALTGAH